MPPYFGWPVEQDEGYSTDLVVTDIDGDGALEAVASLAGTRDPFGPHSTAGPGGVLCQLDEPRTCATLTEGGAYEHSVAVVDLDADGSFEILLGSAPALNCDDWGCSVDSFRRGLLSCVPGGACTELVTVEQDQWVADFVVGDFDGDGDLDVIELSNHVNLSPWPDRLLLNDGSGQLSPAGDPFSIERSSMFGYTGDLDHDGDLDVIRQYFDGAEDAYYLEACMNAGDGSFTCSAPISEVGYDQANPDPTSRILMDIDGDGHLDINTWSGSFALGDGAGGFSVTELPSSRLGTDAYPGYSDYATIDLAASGHLDLAGTQTTRFYLRSLPTLDTQPDTSTIQWYLHFDPERAPIPVDGTGSIVTVPPTDSVSLRLELRNGIGMTLADTIDTAWVETVDLAACQGPVDADGDGCDDLVDPNPDTPDLTDGDGDGLPDACDTCFDVDGDGVPPAGVDADTSGCLAPDGVTDSDDGDRFLCGEVDDATCDPCVIGWYHPRLSGDADNDGICDPIDTDADNDGCADDVDTNPDVPSEDLDGDGASDDCEPDPSDPCVPDGCSATCPNVPPTSPELLGVDGSAVAGDEVDPDDGVLVVIGHADDACDAVRYRVALALAGEASDAALALPFSEEVLLDELLDPEAGPAGTETTTSVVLPASLFSLETPYRLLVEAVDARGAVSEPVQTWFVTPDAPERPDGGPCGCSDDGSGGAAFLPLVWIGLRRRRIGRARDSEGAGLSPSG